MRQYGKWVQRRWDGIDFLSDVWKMRVSYGLLALYFPLSLSTTYYLAELHSLECTLIKCLIYEFRKHGCLSAHAYIPNSQPPCASFSDHGCHAVSCRRNFYSMLFSKMIRMFVIFIDLYISTGNSISERWKYYGYTGIYNLYRIIKYPITGATR